MSALQNHNADHSQSWSRNCVIGMVPGLQAGQPRVRFDFQKGQFSLLSTVQTAPEPPRLLPNGYRKSLQEPPTVGLVSRVTATGGTPLNPTNYFMAFAGTTLSLALNGYKGEVVHATKGTGEEDRYSSTPVPQQ